MEIDGRVILSGATESFQNATILDNQCTVDGYGFKTPRGFRGKLAPTHGEIVGLIKYFLPVNGIILVKNSLDRTLYRLATETEGRYIDQLARKILNLIFDIQGQNYSEVSHLEYALLLPAGTIVKELENTCEVCWDDNPEVATEVDRNMLQKVAPNLSQMFCCIQEFFENEGLVFVWLKSDTGECIPIQEEIEHWHVGALTKDLLNFLSQVQGGPELHKYKQRIELRDNLGGSSLEIESEE